MAADVRLKMYILVRDDVSTGHAVVGVAHASLAAYLRFRDAPETLEWVGGVFYKTVCRVTAAEFEAAKNVEDHVVITEAALGGAETVVAFRPRVEWPKAFKFFRLFK